MISQQQHSTAQLEYSHNQMLELKHYLPYENSIASFITLPKASIYSRVKSVKDAGFDSFELMENDLPDIMDDLPRFKKYLDDIGLKISIFQPFRDLEGSWNGFENRLASFSKRLDVMKELNIHLILVCSNCQLPKFEIPQSAFVEQLQIASDLARGKGIKIAYEALSWGTYISKFEQNWEIVKLVNRSNLGICIDSFHLFIHGSKLDIIDEMAGKVFFVQLSDSMKLKMPKLIDHARNFRYLPGQGSFPIGELVKKIHDVGYDGPMSLECFCGPFKSFNDLGYVSREALASLYNVQLDLIREGGIQADIPRQLNFQTCHVKGFKSSRQHIEFKNPNADLDFEILVSPVDTFKIRHDLFQYGMFLDCFKKFEPLDKDIWKSITFHCSRLTFNSLLIYIKSVLGLKEENSRNSYFGLPEYKTFTNGVVSINLECDDNQMPLKSSF